MPTAMITGASAGIGYSFAEQLAARGYSLVLVARREGRLRELASRLAQVHGITAEPLVADLSSPDGTASVERRLIEGSPIDLLVNNAGFAARGKIAQLDLDAFEAMLRVNVVTLARLASAALRQMVKAKQGAIINIASGTVFMQMPSNAGYGSTKNFVMAFTRHLQVEAANTGVQVQLLIPGVVDTEFHQVAGATLASYPPQIVMQANDLVSASLRALELGEPVCIPSLPEPKDWEAYIEAERQLQKNVSRDELATRYRS